MQMNDGILFITLETGECFELGKVNTRKCHDVILMGRWETNNWHKVRRGGILHRRVQIKKALKMMRCKA